ncbi:hypothetical protein HEP86_20370 [Streptomyces sp. RPA4-5]|uniref:hypothetical protein n=1 Tax=Streptomyces TaxID=1883 RepID=UPI00143E4048|nr:MULTISPECIES: hypothetical protein [Streptomyces]MCX4639346.1 hypothetical protein [Streptomyces platensis]QIY53170.1 hypothetical protein HEP86_20370 [Streptomyces sp. RPA4-5]
MVAPGFRSRIATGLLVAAVVLPVPIGATSAAAADRRATPVDRPPLLARPGDQLDDVPGADGFGLDGLDDFAIGPPPVDGPGAGGGRVRAGHRGHPGAPALPDRYPGLPDALPGVPHRPSHHHHFGGLRGHGRWHHHPHHPFGPDFPPYSLPDDGSADFTGPGRHRHPDVASDADRAHARPGRRAPKKHHKPAASASHEAAATPSRPAPSRRYDVADRFSRRTYEALPPLPTPTPKGGSVPESTADDAAATATPYAMDTPVAPVERVLPMGAGLALTGLGLAFFALRLRRG